MRRALMLLAIVTGAASLAVASGTEDAPDTAFALRGSDMVYDQADDFRWRLDGATLLLQTRTNKTYTVEVLSENVVRVMPRTGRPYLLFRIGSPEYQRMARFRSCVETNRGEKLYELKDCGDPLRGLDS